MGGAQFEEMRVILSDRGNRDARSKLEKGVLQIQGIPLNVMFTAETVGKQRGRAWRAFFFSERQGKWSASPQPGRS
jgi:hypothetical protein